MEQEQVHVYGEVIPLVDVVGGPGVNARLPADVVIGALLAAGFDDEEAVDVAAKLRAEDYDVPSAWAGVERAELKALGISGDVSKE